MKADRTLIIVGAGVALLGAFGLYAWKRGGVGNAAAAIGQAVGAGVTQVAGGAVTGVVDTVSEAVALPTTSQTTTDAAVARWLIDNAGHFEASKWAGAPAYLRALTMDAGSGRAPDPSSPVGQAFGHLAYSQTDTGDEAQRLAARYPAPLDLTGSVFNDAAPGSFAGAIGQTYPFELWSFNQ